MKTSVFETSQGGRHFKVYLYFRTPSSSGSIVIAKNFQYYVFTKNNTECFVFFESEKEKKREFS